MFTSALHEESQLNAVRQMVEDGVPIVMAMDNLDSQFHPPYYVEKYSASFYQRASEICHKNGANFFIHACGNQKDNIKIISDLGVDGLEGVAFPPLGDVELDEVMKQTHDRFIVTGGITAIETSTLKTRKEIFSFTYELFERMRPFRNRFIYSASCNTAIDTNWETIRDFRDAWKEYASI
jgi:uroporphyrinogen-III decarboxylase